MTTTTRAHIYPCERAAGEHRGRWIIQTYHAPTGMPYADDLCPHYATRAEAALAAYEAALAAADAAAVAAADAYAAARATIDAAYDAAYAAYTADSALALATK